MPSKKEKNPLKLWLIITVAIMIPAVLFVVFRFSSKSEFERRVATLAQEGYPVSLDDLADRSVPPEGVENAANVYIEAFSYYQFPTTEEDKWRPIGGNYIVPDDAPPFRQEVMDAMESYLQRNQKTLELLERAAGMECCLWPRTYDNLSPINEYFTDIKNVAQMLTEQALYLAQMGDVDKLYDSLCTAIGLTKSLSKQAVITDHLVMVALNALIAGNLEDVLSQVDFTEPQLQLLQQQSLEMQDADALHDAIINDRCYTIDFWRHYSEQSTSSGLGQYLYSATGLKDRGAINSLDLIKKYLAASKLPLDQRNEAFVKAENEANSGLFGYIHYSMGIATTSLSKINDIDLGVIGSLRCAETALAIERYKIKHQSLPASLQAFKH